MPYKLHFICDTVPLSVSTNRTQWFDKYQVKSEILLPIAHGEGRYQCNEDTLHLLEDQDSIALRYLNNPNGSICDIAGITNSKGKVLGLMPHPERACDPLTGGLDGIPILQALISS